MATGLNGWNYRMVSRDVVDGEVFIAIHEVYYDKENRPKLVTVEPVGIAGSTVEELRSALADYAKALEKPVLRYEDFEDDTLQRNRVPDGRKKDPGRNRRKGKRNQSVHHKGKDRAAR